MIGGYASHGFGLKALELFEAMKWYKVRPTYMTFISVLNACAHAGLVEEGRRYFQSMVSDFGIVQSRSSISYRDLWLVYKDEAL